MPPDFISFFDDQYGYLDNQDFILTNFVGRNSIILKGNEIPGYEVGNIITYTLFYNAHYPKIVDGGKYYNVLAFAEGNDIPLNVDNYINILIPTEADRTTTTNSFEIPDLIAELIPHYVVSKLLAQDDKVRSAQEMNEFEIMLSRVNVDQNERQREYHSSKGWY